MPLSLCARLLLKDVYICVFLTCRFLAVSFSSSGFPTRRRSLSGFPVLDAPRHYNRIHSTFFSPIFLLFFFFTCWSFLLLLLLPPVFSFLFFLSCLVRLYKRAWKARYQPVLFCFFFLFFVCLFCLKNALFFVTASLSTSLLLLFAAEDKYKSLQVLFQA